MMCVCVCLQSTGRRKREILLYSNSTLLFKSSKVLVNLKGVRGKKRQKEDETLTKWP